MLALCSGDASAHPGVPTMHGVFQMVNAGTLNPRVLSRGQIVGDSVEENISPLKTLSMHGFYQFESRTENPRVPSSNLGLGISLRNPLKQLRGKRLRGFLFSAFDPLHCAHFYQKVAVIPVETVPT